MEEKQRNKIERMHVWKIKTQPSTPCKQTPNEIVAVVEIVVEILITMMSQKHHHCCFYSYFILINKKKKKNLSTFLNHSFPIILPEKKKKSCFLKGFSKFSVYWAYDDNCCSVLLNDRVLSPHKIRSSFFSAFYFFTQLRGSKKIITNNAWRMAQLMLIYTTN